MTIDTEVYDEDGQLMMQANNRGATIMLICDIGEGATEYLQIPKSNVSIGEMMVMDATQLKVGGKVPDHNKWFFKFVEMFDDCLEKVRFIELRPKQV